MVLYKEGPYKGPMSRQTLISFVFVSSNSLLGIGNMIFIYLYMKKNVSTLGISFDSAAILGRTYLLKILALMQRQLLTLLSGPCKLNKLQL